MLKQALQMLSKNNACNACFASICSSVNKLKPETRARIIACLVEGNSIRSTVRMTGAAKNTIVKLLKDVGAACSAYQDKAFRNLKCRRLQCDEIWSFVGAKDKNCTPEMKEKGAGDAWT